MAENLSENIKNKEEITQRIINLQIFLESIIDSTPNGIITINDQFITTQINRSALHILELNSQKNGLIETKIFNIIPHLKDFVKQINTVLETGEMHKLESIEYTTNNKNKILNYTFTPLKGPSIQGIVILVEDVTEKQNLEKQLIHSKKMEAIGTLAGGIAHDFNNILNIIMGNTSLLKLHIIEPHLIHKINSINTAINRASALVKQILIFSRKAQSGFKPFQLYDVMNEVINMSQEFFPPSIRLTKHFETDHISINGDPNQISQILLNLFINARDAINNSKHKNDGTINIWIKEIANDPIIVKLYGELKSEKFVEIRISDNGCGMKKETVDRIFEPFYTTKEQGEGTGLGLSIVYKIIESHGGAIKAYSDLGIGTSFVILLPIIKQAVNVTESENNDTICKGIGNIVLVDDENDILDIAQEMLESCNYQVNTFNNGFDALAFIQDQVDKIDLIIVDVMMPQMSGINLFSKLKDLKINIPVIFSTGYIATDELTAIKQKFGDILFLHKPYNIKELSDIVLKTIAKSKNS